MEAARCLISLQKADFRWFSTTASFDRPELKLSMSTVKLNVEFYFDEKSSEASRDDSAAGLSSGGAEEAFKCFHIEFSWRLGASAGGPTKSFTKASPSYQVFLI